LTPFSEPCESGLVRERTDLRDDAAPEVRDDVLEGEIRLGLAELECAEIVGVLGQDALDRLADRVGNGPVGFRPP